MEAPYVENTIDFKALFTEIRHKWYLFLISLILIAPLAWLYATYTQNYYETSGSILVKKQDFGSYEANEAFISDPRVIERSIILRDEISKIKSNDMIRQTLEKLPFNISYFTAEPFWPDFMKENWLNELYSEAPFTVVIDSSANQLTGLLVHIRINEAQQIQLDAEGEEISLYNYASDQFVKLIPAVSLHAILQPGELFHNDNFSFRILVKDNMEPGRDYYFQLHTPKAVVNHYRDFLSVSLPQVTKETEATRVIQISLVGPEPNKSNIFLNELIDTYTANDLRSKNERGSHTINFLEKNVAEAEDSLTKAKLALQSFKANNSIVDINNSKLLSMDQLSTLVEEKNLLENKLSYYQRTLANLNQNNANVLVAPSSVGVNDAIFEKLIIQYIELKSKAEIIINYDNKYNPLVEKIDGQLKSLRESIKDNLESYIKSIQISLYSVKRRLKELTYKMSTFPENEQQLVGLEKNVGYYQEKYDYLIKKRTDAELALATNRPDIEIIDSFETLDEPVAPNKKLVYLFAVVLTMILPLGFIIPKYFLKKRLIDKNDLENHTEIPLLGMITHGAKNSKLVLNEPQSAFVAESFEYVRINLQYYFKDEFNKLIGITSSIGGEGKTFCSSNLACSFAGSGLRTLLIEADLRKPKLDTYFKKDTLYGLSDYLDRDIGYEKIVRSTHVPHLDIIFAGSSEGNPIKLLESQNMEELLDRVKRIYDKVIVDTPPVGLVADYLLLQRFFDINIFVVRNNYTDKDNIKAINEIQENNSIKNINLLFNGVKSFSGYGYIKNSNGYYKDYGKRKAKLT